MEASGASVEGAAVTFYPSTVAGARVMARVGGLTDAEGVVPLKA